MSIIHINRRIKIPEREIEFRHTTSSGPGGQHANRSQTRVELIFEPLESETLRMALSGEERGRMMRRLERKLTKTGKLIVGAEDSRSQVRNRELAIARFQSLMGEALKRPKRRKKTRPSRRANERRLEKKKRRGRKKRNRGRDWGKGHR